MKFASEIGKSFRFGFFKQIEHRQPLRHTASTSTNLKKWQHDPKENKHNRKQLHKTKFFNSEVKCDKVSDSKTWEKASVIRRSKLMDQLYGEETSRKVFERLEYLDHELNKDIQDIAYDYYWALPGLNMREKSLVTITSLIVLSREEQTRIHFNGFLNSGGTIDDIIALLLYMSENFGESSERKGLSALVDVLDERNISREDIASSIEKFDAEILKEEKTLKLSEKDLAIVNVSSSVASGDLSRIDSKIADYIDSHDGDFEDVRNIIRHQIVYCGFPAAMNGFARMRKVLEDKFSAELFKHKM